MTVLRRIYTKGSALSRFAALLLMCLLFSSCKKENNTDPMGLQEFLKREDCGLFGHGGFLFRYNESHCQFSINSMRRQVRMQDDTQSDYVNIQFTVFPTPSAEGVELLLRYKVGDDEISSRCFMEIVKYESDKFWLWDKEAGLGIITPCAYNPYK